PGVLPDAECPMSRFVPAGVVAACVVPGAVCRAEHTTDSLDAVKKSLADEKAVLVDVREEAEWKGGHLKGATDPDLSDLRAGVPADRIKATLPPGSVVYLHCASGRRCL